ncbi:c-type cytochrome [Sulfurimonas sediminis]|uniref:C-type cytochrome n=1 Tax=Sulfurimonas sediminis TaxID=2590020 RepID=A0A7M1B3X8_9BACT|nr:c-type cytochrome [Sulfurimonas sediminis]QOP43408.1 c-type cytochrome [Sulfurimonas sediminis]
MYRYMFLISILFFTACEQKSHSNLNGKQLLEQKCSKCHNIDLPPKTFQDEKAPPMMAVAFHIKDFIKASSESDKIPKSIEFVKDYVINPSASKSFCDKKSLQEYGVMPSQKGKVTEDELQAIAEYMFSHFTLKNLTEAQALQNRLAKMPKGERLALQNGCLSCHKINQELVGPSFKKIAKHYEGNISAIAKSLKSGSKGKWQGYRGAVMPAFGKRISQKNIETLSAWIAKSNKEIKR